VTFSYHAYSEGASSGKGKGITCIACVRSRSPVTRHVAFCTFFKPFLLFFSPATQALPGVRLCCCRQPGFCCLRRRCRCWCLPAQVRMVPKRNIATSMPADFFFLFVSMFDHFFCVSIRRFTPATPGSLSTMRRLSAFTHTSTQVPLPIHFALYRPSHALFLNRYLFSNIQKTMPAHARLLISPPQALVRMQASYRSTGTFTPLHSAPSHTRSSDCDSDGFIILSAFREDSEQLEEPSAAEAAAGVESSPPSPAGLPFCRRKACKRLSFCKQFQASLKLLEPARRSQMRILLRLPLDPVAPRERGHTLPCLKCQ
jgi:hypothetical protein